MKEKNWYLPIILFVALVIHNLVYYFSFNSSFPFDDAFITFRYAENICNGYGWVYNIGEVTSGATSLLYTGLISLFVYLFKTNAITVGRLLPIIFSSLLLIISTILFQEYLKSKIYLLVYVILFILSPTIYTMGLSGMETGFFLCTIVLILLALHKKLYLMASIVAGLLIYIRIDGLLFIAIYTLYIISINNIGINKKIILLSVTGLLITSYFLVNLFFFDLFIPLSMHAKSITYENTELIQDRIIVFYSFFRAKLVFILLPLSVVGFILIFKQRKGLSNILAFFPFLWIAAYIIYNPWMRDWYYFIPYIFLILLSVFALANINQLLSWVKNSNKHNRIIQQSITLFFLILMAIYFLRYYDINFGRSKEGSFVRSITNTAEFLSLQNSIKQKSIFIGDIGYIGYITQAKIIDYVGLVYPKALLYTKYKRHYKSGSNIDWRKMEEFIREENPDFLVFSKKYSFYNSLKDSSSISMTYNLINEKTGMDIWKKN